MKAALWFFSFLLGLGSAQATLLPQPNAIALTLQTALAGSPGTEIKKIQADAGWSFFSLWLQIENQSYQTYFSESNIELALGLRLWENLLWQAGWQGNFIVLAEISEQYSRQAFLTGLCWQARAGRLFFRLATDGSLQAGLALQGTGWPLALAFFTRLMPERPAEISAEASWQPKPAYGFSLAYSFNRQSLLAGGWLKLNERLALSATSSWQETGPGLQLSLQYHFAAPASRALFGQASQSRAETTAGEKPAGQTAAPPKPKAQKKAVSAKPKPRPPQAPEFSLLLRWGISPADALQISRAKDICVASPAAEKILKAHHWQCQRAAKNGKSR